MLGRFVCPASRLDELGRSAAGRTAAAVSRRRWCRRGELARRSRPTSKGSGAAELAPGRGRGAAAALAAPRLGGLIAAQALLRPLKLEVYLELLPGERWRDTCPPPSVRHRGGGRAGEAALRGARRPRPPARRAGGARELVVPRDRGGVQGHRRAPPPVRHTDGRPVDTASSTCCAVAFAHAHGRRSERARAGARGGGPGASGSGRAPRRLDASRPTRSRARVPVRRLRQLLLARAGGGSARAGGAR